MTMFVRNFYQLATYRIVGRRMTQTKILNFVTLQRTALKKMKSNPNPLKYTKTTTINSNKLTSLHSYHITFCRIYVVSLIKYCQNHQMKWNHGVPYHAMSSRKLDFYLDYSTLSIFSVPLCHSLPHC